MLTTLTIRRGAGPFQGDGVTREGDVANYDGEIAFVDDHLGRLLRFMRDRGLLERTLVIVTADHGEYFGEHGLKRHMPVLYEQVLSVPLIVRMPGGSPSGRVARWTGLQEVRGLVREVVAGQSPLSILGARDAPVALAEAWSGATLQSEPSSVAVYFDDFKLLASRSGPGALFDLSADPNESKDLLRTPSPTTARIEARMRQALALDTATRMGEAPEAPSEAVERLRALGYLR